MAAKFSLRVSKSLRTSTKSSYFGLAARSFQERGYAAEQTDINSHRKEMCFILCSVIVLLQLEPLFIQDPYFGRGCFCLNFIISATSFEF